MKRLLLLACVLAVAVAATLTYQTLARAREYRAFLTAGDRALRHGETSVAIEAYSGAIALRSDSTVAHLRRGEAYQRRGDFDAAARDFRTASDLDPTSLRPLEALGDVMYQRQLFTRAAETYEQYLRLNDRTARVQYKLALTRYREGDGAGAMAPVTRALTLDPQFADAEHLQGLCLRDAGRGRDAERAFERAVELQPAMAAPREELADLYSSDGRLADAVAQLQVVAGLRRNRVEAQVALGLAHARAGHPDVGVVTLRTALDHSPDRAVLYAALGRIWLGVAESTRDTVALGKALEALARATGGSDASSESLALYGRALLRNRQPDLALRYLGEARRRFPVAPEACLTFADIAERQGDASAARQALLEYDALVTGDSGRPARALRIARLSATLGDLADAVAWLNRAADGTTSDADLLVRIAHEQLRVGDKVGAALNAARARAVDPRTAPPSGDDRNRPASAPPPAPATGPTR